MNLTITPNMNTKKHPSFGLVSIMKPIKGWTISLSTLEHDEVYVEGFKSFKSVYAVDAITRFRDYGEDVLKPKYFRGLKETLKKVLDAAQKQLPLFTAQDRKEVEAILDNPAPESIITKNGELIIGDLFGD